MGKSRSQKLRLNTISGIVKEIISILCGFILPRYYLISYGSRVNGLISSITQFLGFIAFLEMGIGPVIQSNLYKPLAEQDEDKVAKIIVSAKRFFNKIGFIFLVYIAFLIVCYPRFISNEFDFEFTASLIIIISISSLAQYFFGITYQLLLNADQLAYVQLNCQTVTLVINTAVSVVLMSAGCSVQIVKLVSSLIFVIRPLFYQLYVKKHYHLKQNIIIDSEPIQQKWNGISQHIAAVITQNTDVVLLTLLSTLQNVSVYTVYYTVVIGVERLVMTAATGLESMWGNMIAKAENNILLISFRKTEWVMHSAVMFLFTVTAIMVTPFVLVYTKGVTDANYNAPLFGVLLTVAYGWECLRVPYFRMVKAYGHYKQTQMAALIQPIINMSLSILLVLHYGLIGVAIGTICAMAYHTIYLAYYSCRNLLNVSLVSTGKQFAVDLLFSTLAFVCTKWVKLYAVSYGIWVMKAALVSGICISLSVLINAFFYRNNLVWIINKIVKHHKVPN